MDILAIDIGGTKTLTAVCSIEDGRVVQIHNEATWQSRRHHSFDEVVQDWRKKHPATRIDGVGIGVAGPVSGGFLKRFGRVTNLAWNLDASALSTAFGNVPVYLCNDMEAHGWGILGLSPDQLITLNEGVESAGNKALIAAGTGLGESLIAWDGRRHIPLGGEGGHAAFSPSTEQEDRLLVYLRKKLQGHVSWERILGGRDGFRNLAQFMAEDLGTAVPSELITVVGDHDDWGAGVIQLAQNGHGFCDNLLRWYASLYGREAANLALKCVPHHGLYIGGGIAPRIRPWLKRAFIEGFTDKGRFAKLLADIPVHVIQDKLNGLKGAGIGAWHMIRRGR